MLVKSKSNHSPFQQAVHAYLESVKGLLDSFLGTEKKHRVVAIPFSQKHWLVIITLLPSESGAVTGMVSPRSVGRLGPLPGKAGEVALSGRDAYLLKPLRRASWSPDNAKRDAGNIIAATLSSMSP